MTFKNHSAFIFLSIRGLLDPWPIWPCMWSLLNLPNTWTVTLNTVCICFLHLHFLAHKRKKCCWSDISIAPLFPKGFCVHSLLGEMQLLFNRHRATLYNSLRQDAKEAILYAAERDKGSQCQQMQLPDVNFGPGGQGKHSFKKCYGTFNARKSLQPWHHILLKTESSEVLTLCCCIDPRWGGGGGSHGLIADLPTLFRR